MEKKTKKRTAYGIECTTEFGHKLLCWQEKRYFYFAYNTKGFDKAPFPTLFNTKKEASEALDNIPTRGGNSKQFKQVVKSKGVKIIKLELTY